MADYLTNQIMYWNEVKITDHNRRPLAESFEIIERKSRMANGRLRKYVIAQKKNWSTSWDDLPSHNNVAGAGTVDTGIGGTEMEEFYLDNIGSSIALTLKDGQGNTKKYTVMISEFSKEISKRGIVDFFNINVSLEEV